ncbi:MAG: alpha-keto acid decarboxylase family protein, partial [Thermomicrobiales bacterium]
MAGNNRTTIGGYLLKRLQELGVGHIFGVPGDFVLGFMTEIEASPVELINTCDEQGAGFAADAYARLRGIGAVCVTYGVGGLKLANTTGQAYAERVPVVVISGAPSMAERRRNPLIHHKVRSYDTQLRVFQQLTVAWTVLDDPDDACREIDRVLRLCQRYSRPVYIELPRDMVDVEVEIESWTVVEQPASNPSTLAASLTEAVAWINRAEQPVIFFGVELYRFGLQDEALALIEASGIPAAVTLLDKGAIEERSPLFLGVYAGALGRDDVRRYVEESDCLIMLGTLLTDINLGIATAKIDPARCIHITHDRLAVGLHTYENVRLDDFVRGLGDAGIEPRSNRDHPHAPLARLEGVPETERDASVTVAHLFERLASYLTEETIVIADPGDALFGSIDLPVQEARAFLSPAFYASLGFAVPAAIGAQCARPEDRPLVLVGDGAFQMTGMELSTCAKFGLDPIVIVLNNDGYTTERLIIDGGFNDIQQWNFSALPEVFQTGRSFLVRTRGELEVALEAARERTG